MEALLGSLAKPAVHKLPAAKFISTVLQKARPQKTAGRANVMMAAKKGIDLSGLKQAVAPFLEEKCQRPLGTSYCRVVPKLISLHEKMCEFLAESESNEREETNTTSPRPPCGQNPVHARNNSNISFWDSSPITIHCLSGSSLAAKKSNGPDVEVTLQHARTEILKPIRGLAYFFPRRHGSPLHPRASCSAKSN